MLKCKCGFKTWNKRRYKKHFRECEVDGQAVEGNTEGQEVEGKQAKETKTEKVVIPTEKPIKIPFYDEVDKYEDMNIHQLRGLVKEKGFTGINSRPKAELIKLLRAGG